MGKLYTYEGRLNWRLDDAQEAQYPIPDDATDLLDIDFEANAPLLETLNRDYNGFALERGTLTYHGEAVQIAQETARRGVRKAAALLQGKSVANLTATDVRILLALLLYERGYLAADGTIDFGGLVRTDTRG